MSLVFVSFFISDQLSFRVNFPFKETIWTPDETKFTPAGKNLMSSIDGPEHHLGAEVPPKPDFFNVGDEVVFRYQSIQFFAEDRN